MAQTRNRLLERAPQLELFTNPNRTWEQIPIPQPLTGNPTRYQKIWARYITAATELGWTPADVAEHGTSGLAAALAETGLRHWGPSTVCLYAKVARFAGVDPHRHPPQPPARDFNASHAPRLWTTTSINPVTIRSALFCLITWHWPTSTENVLALTTNDVTASSGVLVLPNGLVVPDKNGTWGQWETARRTISETRWLFCTTYPSATSRPGQQLSDRAARWGFNYHATLAGHPTLTTATYRKHSPHNQHP